MSGQLYRNIICSVLISVIALLFANESGASWGSCTTESGRASFGGNGGTVTLTTPITSLSNAFVLVKSTAADSGGNSASIQDFAIGEITDANTLTFTRDLGVGNNLEVSYQVVQCPDGEFTVQRGNILLSGAATSNTATISNVDTSRSLVIVSSRSADTTINQNQAWVTGELTNGTTVTASRDASGTDTNVHYQVVEFTPASGVTVQTGERTVVTTDIMASPAVVSITAVNDASSWLYFSGGCPVSGLDDCKVAGNIYNAGNELRFYHESEGTVRARWYVVEFPGASGVSVQRGISNYNAGADPATHNIAVTAVSAVDKAFPWTSNTTLGNGTAFPRNLWVERLSSTSNIEMQGWNMDTANADAQFEWQVVEFPADGTPPTVGSVSVTAGNSGSYVGSSFSLSATITEPDSTPSCAFSMDDGSTYPISGTVNGASSPYTCTVTNYSHGQSNGSTLNLKARAVSAGGTGASATATVVTVDTAAPTTSISPAAGTYYANQSVTLTPSDAGSGVASTEYCVGAADSGASCTLDSTGTSFTVSGVSNETHDYPVCYRSTDNLGFVESTKCVTYTIDLIPNDNTTAGTVTATAQHESIIVTAPYSGDNNNNNSLLVEWGECVGACDVADLTDSSGTITHAASPYQYTIGGLNNGSTYLVRVTYQETNPDTVTNSPQTVIDLVPANILLHNSQVTGSTYYNTSGGWGLTGSFTGKFTCSTCHTKDTTNIKRVKTDISFPNSATMPNGTTNSAVIFLDPTDMGHDQLPTNPRLTSTRICEVCHSATQYHRYDTQSNHGTYGPQALYTHQNGTDCINCHKHNQGFAAGCDACHGNPPGNGTLVADLYPSEPTLSTDWGKHDEHVNGQGYSDCNTCHTGWEGDGQMPNGGDLNIGFSLTHGGTGNNYDGRSTNNGYTGDSGKTFVSVGNNMTCANYCHGATIGGETLVTAVPADGAVWDSTNNSWAGCGTCHAASEGDVGTAISANTSNVSHLTHAGTAGTDIFQNTAIILDCNNCHGANYSAASASSTTPAGHVDGNLSFNMSAMDASYNSVSGTINYNGLSSGSEGLAPTNYDTCSNVACHWNNETPTWNTPASVFECTLCHNNGVAKGTGTLDDAAPASGSHAKHAGANDEYVTCDSCHGTSASAGGHDGHIDFNLTLDFGVYGSIYDNNGTVNNSGWAEAATNYPSASDDSCSAACHNRADWGMSGTYNTGTLYGYPATLPTGLRSGDFTDTCNPATWATQLQDFCLDCHSNVYNSKAGPSVVSGVNFGSTGNTLSGSHLLNNTTTDSLEGDDTCQDLVDWKNRCLGCHTKHNDATAIKIDLPTTSYDNPATAGADNINMRTQLGINYVGYNHVGIYLNGSLGSNEADACWTCHDANNESVSEWGYNTDTTPGTWPETQIASRDDGSVRSHNYGWVYDSAANRNAGGTTGRTNRWVASDGSGYYHRDGYSTAPELQRQILAVHSADVNVSPDVTNSSVNSAILGTGVLSPASQELPGEIRCTYCHDVHDLDLNSAVAGVTTGKPYLRGSWLGNPYAPDMPPLDGYTYETTGFAGPGVSPDFNIGNRWRELRSNNQFAVGLPRLFSSISRSKGGYFIDQNSNWPATTLSLNEDLSDSAGLCVLCHGTDVDNMDYYTSDSLWRDNITFQVSGATAVNGHSNSTVGGLGSNASDLFDARRNLTVGGTSTARSIWKWMGMQRGVVDRGDGGGNHFGNDNEYGLPKSNFPGNASAVGGAEPGNPGGGDVDLPMTNIGWFGGTPGTYPTAPDTMPSQYYVWYAADSIGTDGSSDTARAHNFTCSKCHSPHASGLPALLITNCLDPIVGTWDGGGRGVGPGAVGNNYNGYVGEIMINCHRKEDNTTTGWHRLAGGQ